MTFSLRPICELETMEVILLSNNFLTDRGSVGLKENCLLNCVTMVTVNGGLPTCEMFMEKENKSKITAGL